MFLADELILINWIWGKGIITKVADNIVSSPFKPIYPLVIILRSITLEPK